MFLTITAEMSRCRMERTKVMRDLVVSVDRDVLLAVMVVFGERKYPVLRFTPCVGPLVLWGYE